MRHTIFSAFGFVIVFGCALAACKAKEEVHVPAGLINTKHLDTLYEDFVIDGDSVGIIHIYCEYPDYHFVDDADEGFTCVDDVARAAIFYARQFKKTGDPEYERKMKRLTRFLFAMQSPNGYFYNFLWPDGTINTGGITSKPIADWWSWRALWAMGEVYQVLSSRTQEPLLAQINQHRHKLLQSVLADSSYRSTALDTIEGMVVPTWLPGGAAADEAAILMCGLVDFYNQQDAVDSQLVSRDSVAQLMRRLGAGIMLMQVHQPDSVHDGAFMSANNLWHAYGQAQAYALLKASAVLADSAMRKAALYEITQYYPAFISAGGWDHYFLRRTGSTVERYDVNVFSQIAYARRPPIWACVAAAKDEPNAQYLKTAIDLGNWFFGDNPASQQMYDPMTGRGYDGISSPQEINRNAGAESTIESLLAMQALESAGVYYDPNQKKLVQRTK